MKLYFIIGGGCLAGPVAATAISLDHRLALRSRTARPLLASRGADNHAFLWARDRNPFLVARDLDDVGSSILHARTPGGSKASRGRSRSGSLAGSRAGSDASGVQTPREKSPSPSPRPHKQVNFNTPSPGPDRSMSPSMESSGTPFRGVTPESIRSHSRPPSGSLSPSLSPGPGQSDDGYNRGTIRRGGPSRASALARGGGSAGSDHGTTRGGYRSRGSPKSSASRGGRSRGSSAMTSQTSTPRPQAAAMYGFRAHEYANPSSVPSLVPYQHAEHQGGFNQFSFQGPQNVHDAQHIQAYHPSSSSLRLPQGQWAPASISVHSGGTHGYLETRHGLTAAHMRDSTRVAPIMPSAPDDPSTVLAQNPEAIHGVTDATAMHAGAISGARATGSRAVGTRITTAPGSRAAIISTAGGQRTESVKTVGNAAGAVAMWSQNHLSDANPIQHTALLHGSGRIQTSAFNVEPPQFFQRNQGQGF